MEQNGQLLAHYAYNGARQRVAKTVGNEEEGTTTYFTWHRGLLDAELDSQGRVERRIIYFHLRPVALIDYRYAPDKTRSPPHSAQHSAIHGDHLGTPQSITDGQQRVVWTARYDSFGRAAVQGLESSDGEPFAFNLRFAGQYQDSETGWHYNWHRFYEPDTGRYLTPDPIGLRGGDNAYAYAQGDPLEAVDPTGLIVYLTSHRTPPTSSWHSALLLVPDDQDAFVNRPGFVLGNESDGIANDQWYRVISARPESNNLFFPGWLIGEINMSTDLPGRNQVHRQVHAREPLHYLNACSARRPSDRELVEWLIQVSESYSNNAPYAFPSNFSSTDSLPQGGFNSNSYVSGILSMLGSDLALPSDNRYPGWDRPLPSHFFTLPAMR